MLFVRKNALQVLIPKYGLEATLYLDSKTVTFEYDEHVSQETRPIYLYMCRHLQITCNTYQYYWTT